MRLSRRRLRRRWSCRSFWRLVLLPCHRFFLSSLGPRRSRTAAVFSRRRRGGGGGTGDDSGRSRLRLRFRPGYCSQLFLPLFSSRLPRLSCLRLSDRPAIGQLDGFSALRKIYGANRDLASPRRRLVWLCSGPWYLSQGRNASLSVSRPRRCSRSRRNGLPGPGTAEGRREFWRGYRHVGFEPAARLRRDI